MVGEGTNGLNELRGTASGLAPGVGPLGGGEIDGRPPPQATPTAPASGNAITMCTVPRA